jgi:hypothetical protein
VSPPALAAPEQTLREQVRDLIEIEAAAEIVMRDRVAGSPKETT